MSSESNYEYLKIVCLHGSDSCQQIVEKAQQFGLSVSIPYPDLTPHIFEIKVSKTPSEETKLIQFLNYYYHGSGNGSDRGSGSNCGSGSSSDSDRGNGNGNLKQIISWFKSNSNADITILSNQEPNRFHLNVLKQPRLIQNYITGVPDVIIPPDMREYYLFPIVTNQMRANLPRRPKIGVISLGGSYLPSDLEYYWVKCRFTDFKPTVTDRPVPHHQIPPFERNLASLENTLDLEIIGGFCPSADLYFYSAPNTDKGYFDAFEMAINDRMDIISTSWGLSEEKFYLASPSLLKIYNDLFYRAVTGRDPITKQKVSNHYTIITAATGDYGSSDNNYDLYSIDLDYLKRTFPSIPDNQWVPGTKYPLPHADFPSTSPWVVACGGTSLFYDSDLDPILADQESTWIYAGGGQSGCFPRPDYQQLIAWKDTWALSPLAYGQFLNQFGFNNQPDARPRTVPDVVFNADPNSPWYIYFSSYDDEGAGTSVCSPIMAGLLGEFFVASNPDAAPRHGYFGDGFNFHLYRAADANIRRVTRGYNITVERNPITRDLNPFGLINQPQNTYYLIWEEQLGFNFCAGKGVIRGTQLITYLNTIVCLVEGTMILMKDGQWQPIETIRRGQEVIGYQGRIFKVAEINRQLVTPNQSLELIEFPPHTLGYQQPRRTLRITPNHPIYYRGARRPARAFLQIGALLIKASSQSILYDLQFDDDGSYYAEGLLVQSRSPWSDLTPLPKELYFNPSRYRSDTHWDGFNHPLPLDNTPLLP